METQTHKLTLEEAVKIFESTNQPSGPLTLDQAFAQINTTAKGEPNEYQKSFGQQIFASDSIKAFIKSHGGRFPEFLAALAIAPLDIVVFGTFLVEAGRLLGLDEANRAQGGR